MKLKKPHCNFCQKDLVTVRVDGSEIGETELVDIEFDVMIDKFGAHAEPTILCKEAFKKTSNTLRYLSMVELWVEDTAEEVRCSLCTKKVKLIRIAPPPAVTTQSNSSGAQNTFNPFSQLMTQVTGSSPTFGQNRATIMSMIDTKFSDQELMDILTDVDMIPQGGPTYSRVDLLALFEEFLYDI